MKKQWFERKYCCGCGMCNSFTQGCIDDRGFYRPNNANEFFKKFDSSVCYCNSVGENVGNNLWGDIKEAYYGYSNDEETRHNASSGGVLTELACFLLNKKIVDCIIQIKVSEESQMKTEVIYSITEQDIKQSWGSRYTASTSLLNILDNIEIDKKYAVIGKPCDIRVIREYLNKHKELEKNIVILLSFFCAGTPSKQANKLLLEAMGFDKSNISKFTYRGNGWPGITTCETDSGNIYSMEYEKSWGKYLGRDIQDICRFCWEGTGEAADICCGDGWYVKNGKPSFVEGKGRNVILARTNKGNLVLKKVQEENKISLEKLDDLEILNEMQPGQYMKKVTMFSKVIAMRLMLRKVPNYNLKQLYKFSKQIDSKKNFRIFIGTIKRILSGKI